MLYSAVIGERVGRNIMFVCACAVNREGRVEWCVSKSKQVYRIVKHLVVARIHQAAKHPLEMGYLKRMRFYNYCKASVILRCFIKVFCFLLNGMQLPVLPEKIQNRTSLLCRDKAEDHGNDRINRMKLNLHLFISRGSISKNNKSFQMLLL